MIIIYLHSRHFSCTSFKPRLFHLHKSTWDNSTRILIIYNCPRAPWICSSHRKKDFTKKLFLRSDMSEHHILIKANTLHLPSSKMLSCISTHTQSAGSKKYEMLAIAPYTVTIFLSVRPAAFAAHLSTLVSHTLSRWTSTSKRSLRFPLLPTAVAEPKNEPVYSHFRYVINSATEKHFTTTRRKEIQPALWFPTIFWTIQRHKYVFYGSTYPLPLSPPKLPAKITAYHTLSNIPLTPWKL